MDSPEVLRQMRLERWAQTAASRTPGPDAAADLIERVGIATHYPASPEIPNLLHAYTGDPEARVEASWDSASGHVYTWRWALGKRGAAFYAAIVRKRPTWVAWRLLPAALRLRGETRSAEDLYAAGELSAGARRVAGALAGRTDPVETGELRHAAGYPTGKEHRAAYLRAVEELETRLLLAKVFTGGEDEDGEAAMGHVLVAERWPDACREAAALTRDAAMDALLAAYLPQAAYIAPTPFARHLVLPEPEVRAACERLAASGAARVIAIDGQRGACCAHVEPASR